MTRHYRGEIGRAEYARLWQSELEAFEASLAEPEPEPAEIRAWRPTDEDWCGAAPEGRGK